MIDNLVISSLDYPIRTKGEKEMSKTRLERIGSIQEEIEQLKTRQKLLQQQHNAQERKARNHRLCRRGGIVEKLLPGIISLTDEQFDAFVEKTLLTGYAERIIKGLAAQDVNRLDGKQGNATGLEKEGATPMPAVTEPGGVPAGIAKPA
jgi:hypothetical protein